MARKLSSAELIERLRGAGYSAKDIGQIVGRNDRMVYRVAKGERDPEGWRESLRKALTTVQNRARRGHKRATPEQLRKVVPEPPRRHRASGADVRLRRGVWQQGAGWATGTIAGQAARSGGQALLAGVQRADARLWSCSVTITFWEPKVPRGGEPRRGTKHYPPKHVPGAPSKKIKVWHAGCSIVPRDLLNLYDGYEDKHLTMAILDYMQGEDILSFEDASEVLPYIERIEMRIWSR